MAIKPVSNESFYREVDEGLRQDQLKSVWKRYGALIVGGVILLLAAVAGAIWWQNRQQAQIGAAGDALVAAFDDIQQGRPKAAAPRLDGLAAESTPGYRAAASLTKGAIAVEAGDDRAAAAAYAQVATNEELAQPYRDLALIRQTAVEFDRLQPAQVIERLRPLAVPGSPWFGSAGEMVAIAHLKAGRPREAAPIFAAIAKDQTLPRSIRSRAVQMAGALGIDATEGASGVAGNPAAEGGR